MRKRLISILLLCCLLLTCVPTFAVPAKAAVDYSASAALDYAKNHWNDGQGLCAEFVSNCVQAGGITIPTIKTTTECANAICAATGLSMQYLTLTNGYAMKAQNESILAAGDVVLQYCATHNVSPHILFCGGYDSAGYATFYAHNSALNNGRYLLSYNTSYEHTTSCDMRAKVVHLTGLGPHEHSYSGTYYDLACPHKIYQKCTCGEKQYTGETYQYPPCWSCHLGSPVLARYREVMKAGANGIKCYLLSTSGANSYSDGRLYDENINGTLYAGTEYLITEIYPNGACKVRNASGGTEVYAPLWQFVKTSTSGYCALQKATTPNQTTTYIRPSGSQYGYTSAGDTVYKIYQDTSSGKTQILYPLLAGGYKLGWISNSSSLPITTYTVSYNANGGSGAPASQTKTDGVTLTLSSTKPTRTGYDFVGWATNSSATTAAYQPGGSYTANASVTLYAVWKAKTYTVSYNANGGTGGPSAQTKTYGVTLILSGTKPTRTGYDFVGWATSNSATTAAYQPGGSYTANASVTLYAVWKAETYTVSYHANGGTGAPSAQTKAYGVTLTLSGIKPIRTGYDFVGWATSSSATTAAYQPGGSYTANASVALYAVWKVKTYTVSYNANGGTGAPESQNKAHGVMLTLSTQKPTREGYYFMGWSADKAATSATYVAGGSFYENNDTTLYAVWGLKPTIEISKANASTPGKAIVTVTLKENPGINYLCFDLRFNSDYLRLYDYEIASALADNATFDTNGYRFEWSADTDITYNGVILTLELNVRTGVSVREVLPIDGQYMAGNSLGEDVNFYLSSGQVLIIEQHTDQDHDYTYKEYTVAPTCTEQGYTAHVCVCGKSQKDSYVDALGHAYQYGVNVAPTTSSAGSLLGICSRCGDTVTITLPKLDTTNYTYTVTVASTCTSEGSARYTWKVSTYGTYRFYVSIPMKAHTYQTEVVAPTCTTEGYTIHTCTACGHSYRDTETDMLEHAYAYSVTQTPSLTEPGELTGICEHCGSVQQITLPMLSSADYTITTRKAATCAEMGTDRYTWKSTAYGTFYFDVQTEYTEHSYSMTTTQPTCTEQGYTTFTCTVCGDSFRENYVAALGHSYSYEVTKEPTETEAGTLTGTCERCGTHSVVALPKLGAEAYTYRVVTASSCKAEGVGEYTWKNTLYGVYAFRVALAKTEHTWDSGRISTEPTEGNEGVMTYTCTVCGVVKTEPIAATGHTHRYSSTVVPASCTEQGYTTHTCRCGGYYTDNYTDPLGHDYHDGVCSRCGAKDPNGRCDGGESCPGRHFTDMPSYKHWAHEGIDFAIERGLVNGTTPTTFSPKKTMTRAMLVTLLWRYEGEPTAENGKTFTDVSPKQYYAKAVAWASSEGIVKGMTDTTFQPNGEITREQMAVLFYRYAEWKGVDMTPRADISGFPDYSRVSGYAREAFRWANATDLIGGSKQNGVNYLLPKGSATREQVATLLMRFIRNIIES